MKSHKLPTKNFKITQGKHGTKKPKDSPDDAVLMKQKDSAKLLMVVQDGQGKKHAIFGDDFVMSALTNVLNKINEMEAYYAEKEGKTN